MKSKIGYLEGRNNMENFYRLLEKKEVVERLGSLIIDKFKMWKEGNKYIELNYYCEGGGFKYKDGGISLKEINLEYFILMLILCENIEKKFIVKWMCYYCRL